MFEHLTKIGYQWLNPSQFEQIQLAGPTFVLYLSTGSSVTLNPQMAARIIETVLQVDVGHFVFPAAISRVWSAGSSLHIELRSGNHMTADGEFAKLMLDQLGDEQQDKEDVVHENVQKLLDAKKAQQKVQDPSVGLTDKLAQREWELDVMRIKMKCLVIERDQEALRSTILRNADNSKSSLQQVTEINRLRQLAKTYRTELQETLDKAQPGWSTPEVPGL